MSRAYSELGEVLQQLSAPNSALGAHQHQLRLAQAASLPSDVQCKALSQTGWAYMALDEHDSAAECFRQQLQVRRLRSTFSCVDRSMPNGVVTGQWSALHYLCQVRIQPRGVLEQCEFDPPPRTAASGQPSGTCSQPPNCRRFGGQLSGRDDVVGKGRLSGRGSIPAAD